jgi:exopolysaccharide biosynthesis protein
VKKGWWLNLILIGLAVELTAGSYWQSTNDLSQQIESESNPDISYQLTKQADSIVHTVVIPHNSQYSVTPVVAEELTSIRDLATKFEATVAINGGYFDPKNEKTTSYIVQEGKVVADPRTNERLIGNPDLKPYQGKILNRAEFRRYLCGENIHHDITLHHESIPADCQLLDAIGGGPQLLPDDTSVVEGFVSYQDGKIIRDAIATTAPNARSAIGITHDGDIVLAMVAQNPESPKQSGMSLPELAEFLSTLGVEKAMNLDGGSSASLFFQGQTFYGKVDAEGNFIKRPIKSILVVQEKTEVGISN